VLTCSEELECYQSVERQFGLVIMASRRDRTVLRWMAIRGRTSRYVTSHSGQLSLLPSAGWEMNTVHGAMVVLCSREGNRTAEMKPRLRVTDHRVSDLGLVGSGRVTGQRVRPDV